MCMCVNHGVNVFRVTSTAMYIYCTTATRDDDVVVFCCFNTCLGFLFILSNIFYIPKSVAGG